MAKDKAKSKETLTTFAKMMEDYGTAGVKMHDYSASGPLTSSGYAADATGTGYPKGTVTIPVGIPFTVSGVPTTTQPPTKTMSDRQLEAAERIATALEAIVERFC